MSVAMVLPDYTVRIVAAGAGMLGLVAGALGCFAVLRRQSLLGDAISHAALPGIVIAFLLAGTKNPLALVLGAAVAGWLGTLAVSVMVRHSRLPADTALGIVLSVFFGAGLVLLTYVQQMPTAAQAGLDTFLFGQAATMLASDVIVIAALGSLSLAAVALFWKEFKLLTFDPEYGATQGLPMHTIDVLLTTFLVIAIVIGLQTVGVVLMSALVIAPAAAARQWTNSLGIMVLLAGGFGAASGVSGALVSGRVDHMPTGPAIVMAAMLLVIASLLLAPERGVLWSAVQRRRQRQQLRTDAVLADLHSLALQHASARGHDVRVLEMMRGGRWLITDAGLDEAERTGQEPGHEA